MAGFETVLDKIDSDVKRHKVLLYVKGNPTFPQCGFSKAVMDIFSHLGVTYETRDVIENPDLREGIKQYTRWPTIPQVFINGKFIGGCDVVTEMYQSGELQSLLDTADEK